MKRLVTVALMVLLPLMLASAAVAYTVLQSRSGAWTMFWTTAPLTSFHPDGGFAYTSPTGRLDLSSHERPSAALVYENGQISGRANVLHSEIRELGRGRFSFWHDYVYVSATDNTDPRTNGRAYTIGFAPFTRSTARIIYGIAAVIWFIGGIMLLFRMTFIGWKQVGARVWTAMPATVRAGASTGGTANGGTAISVVVIAARAVATIVTSAAVGAARLIPARRVPAVGLLTAWVIAVVLVAAAETAYLSRGAQWTWLWSEAEVGVIQPELGNGYVAQLGRTDLGSHEYPQATELLENGVQLGLHNANHAEIREVGRGRYSFWHNDVLFATTDNSDPRTNGRRYTVRYSPISRQDARVLYVVTGLWLLFAVALTLVRILSGAYQLAPVVTQFLSRHALALTTVATVVSLLLPPALRSTPLGAPLVEQAWSLVLVLQLLIAVGVWLRWGGVLPRVLRVACIAAVAAGFTLLTLVAPHRTEGCHTNGVHYPVWSLYCVAPDSASYYFGYTVGSARQPLYPWMIDAVVAGTSFNRQQFVNTVIPGAPRFEADPLFRVVHTQIVLLLVAALIACWMVMGWTSSVLPAVAFLWLYDNQFFSVEEMNIVLTEPIVQTLVILMVAAFAAFLWRPRPHVLATVGLMCGLAYLGRQSALFALLLLMAACGIALLQGARRWWPWCAVAVAAFAAMASVPGIYAYAKTGSFSTHQTTLQYQYRIAHAMQYAGAEDVALMPDEESRAWLADAIVRRDEAHRRVEAQFKDDELNRMIYYIAANLYEVATPIAGFRGESKTPDFYMKVATPILKRHWAEYARFAFRFWQFGVGRPGLARLAMFDFSIWYAYAALGILMLLLRNINALAAAAMVAAHWGAVAIICLAAVPIPRMINASEFLVVLAAVVMVFDASVRVVVPWVSARFRSVRHEPEAPQLQ